MDYVTINEAVRLTGKSATAIRRLVEKLSKEDNRGVVQKEETPQGYKYRISREYLCGHYHIPLETDSRTLEMAVTPADNPADTPTDSPRGNPTDTPSDSRIQIYEDVIVTLKEQLKIKDDQLQHIFDRQRESNMLMNNDQQRLLTIAPKEMDAESMRPDPQVMIQKQSSSWVWIFIGVLILIGLMVFVAIRDGWITFRLF